MKCKQCNQELAGKRQYCDDACRMAFNRTQPEQESEQPEQINPNITNPNTQPEQGYNVDSVDGRYATRTNPELINHGPYMNAAELHKHRTDNKLSKYHNRVAIPGDQGYVGVCQPPSTSNGKWHLVGVETCG